MSAPNSSLFARLFIAPPPPAAIQVDADRVSVVALHTHGQAATITGHAVEPLAPGVVTPVLNGSNVHDGTALATAIRTALDRVSPRPRRAALLLPDAVAKVSILRFDTVPAKAQDLEQLIRWQVRKAAPFRIEDAAVSWSEGAPVPGGGRDYFVVLVRRDIVEAYERACDAAGVHAGLVDIVSPNVANAILATQPGAEAGDWLLVHIGADSSTLLVVRDGQVIFFRNRPNEAGAQDMGDLVHQTAMYYEDRLGGTAFSRVFLSGGTADGGEALRRQIAERLATHVDVVDVTSAVPLRDRIAPGPERLDVLAPAVGVLRRERPAAGASARKGERAAS